MLIAAVTILVQVFLETIVLAFLKTILLVFLEMTVLVFLEMILVFVHADDDSMYFDSRNGRCTEVDFQRDDETFLDVRKDDVTFLDVQTDGVTLPVPCSSSSFS